MSQQHESDIKPAITGLLVGIVFVFIVVFGIVQMVNASFSKPAAGHTTHQQ